MLFKEKRGMTIEEIDELLELNDWSKTELAYHLDMSEAAIWKWYRLKKPVRGAAGVCMRDWLEKARRGEKKQKELAGAK